MGFVWGLLIGVISAAIGGSIVGVIYTRRIKRLLHRAQRAERLAELGTLTSGLAHEIKNPLSTVQLNLQLLQEDLDPTHENHARLTKRLGTVRRETGRLKDILDDFLRYAGQIEIERKPVEVGALLQDLVDFFTPQAQLLKIHLRLRQPSQPLIAQIDERLIKQSVLNLLINAAQAMGSTGGEILLSAYRKDGFVILEVTDTGPGIAPEVVKHIFDAYFSTKRGGTGLGLAISQRVAQEHGGRIDVKSELGKGTSFCILLPAN